MTITTNEKVLSAALLWLRNHYDVGKPAHKDAVLARVDKVLNSVAPLPETTALRLLDEIFPVEDALKPTRSTIAARPVLDSTTNPARVPMQQQERHRPRFEDSPRDRPHVTPRNPED